MYLLGNKLPQTCMPGKCQIQMYTLSQDLIPTRTTPHDHLTIIQFVVHNVYDQSPVTRHIVVMLHIGQDGTWRDKEDASVPQLWAWWGWHHTALGLRGRHNGVGSSPRGAEPF